MNGNLTSSAMRLGARKLNGLDVSVTIQTSILPTGYRFQLTLTSQGDESAILYGALRASQADAESDLERLISLLWGTP